MRQKELRIALVCYGGVSLAVYMHGVTKELWKLARASRALHGSGQCTEGSEAVYCRFLERIADTEGTRLRVLPDILTGASAGGINAVFLAQAIHSGQSLEPLTDLWLECADVERLLDPEAGDWKGYFRGAATPFVRYLLNRPGNVVSDAVAPETEAEVRRKLARLVRSRWFAPPFPGIGFSNLLANAFEAMANAPVEGPLLPPNHPIDLFVTATDFKGYLELLRLHSPPVVEESEHRMPFSFSGATPTEGGKPLANLLELVAAARSTASFPGAFPPLQIGEIDAVAQAREWDWPDQDAFLQRIMPVHYRNGTTHAVSLIDGSVLVNAPFSEALSVLGGRPAQREVDRRFVYIDPRPDRIGRAYSPGDEPIGFFGAVFGSLSTIPREQPIRDNLEELQEQSREAERLRLLVSGLRPEVEQAVDKLFGRTLFLDRPTIRRLQNWRAKAQQAAAEKAGYAFSSYAQVKLAGIVDRLAEAIHAAAPQLELPDPGPIVTRLRQELSERGVERLTDEAGGASEAAIAFFRTHDIAFRIRRLRLLARRLSRDWEAEPEVVDTDREAAQDLVYKALSLYFAKEDPSLADPDFPQLAAKFFDDPGTVVDHLGESRRLVELDTQVEQLLADGFAQMPRALKRRMLLAYLGFPFYDVATLPLLRNEGLTEFEPVKVDRISPDDAHAIRAGGTQATLRGTEFYNFGAFFSRAYRENDYLWGRLHGAERMIDLIASSIEGFKHPVMLAETKREAFETILDEEEGRLTTDRGLIPGIRAEISARYGDQ